MILGKRTVSDLEIPTVTIHLKELQACHQGGAPMEILGVLALTAQTLSTRDISTDQNSIICKTDAPPRGAWREYGFSGGGIYRVRRRGERGGYGSDFAKQEEVGEGGK